jgi:hypothetical protein
MLFTAANDGAAASAILPGEVGRSDNAVTKSRRATRLFLWPYKQPGTWPCPASRRGMWCINPRGRQPAARGRPAAPPWVAGGANEEPAALRPPGPNSSWEVARHHVREWVDAHRHLHGDFVRCGSQLSTAQAVASASAHAPCSCVGVCRRATSTSTSQAVASAVALFAAAPSKNSKSRVPSQPHSKGGARDVGLCSALTNSPGRNQ